MTSHVLEHNKGIVFSEKEIIKCLMCFSWKRNNKMPDVHTPLNEKPTECGVLFFFFTTEVAHKFPAWKHWISDASCGHCKKKTRQPTLVNPVYAIFSKRDLHSTEVSATSSIAELCYFKYSRGASLQSIDCDQSDPSAKMLSLNFFSAWKFTRVEIDYQSLRGGTRDRKT